MKMLSGEDRQTLINDIMHAHAHGTQSLGVSVRRLRLEVTGLDQMTFARMCKLSVKALYLIENDKGNPTIASIDSILRKFGMRLGLVQNVAAPWKMEATQQDEDVKRPMRGANPKRTPFSG